MHVRLFVQNALVFKERRDGSPRWEVNTERMHRKCSPKILAARSARNKYFFPVPTFRVGPRRVSLLAGEFFTVRPQQAQAAAFARVVLHFAVDLQMDLFHSP